MGFPVVYTEVCFPTFFLQTLSFLGCIRNLIFLLFRFLGLSDFFETEVVWSESRIRIPENPPVSAILIREFLPVAKFGDLPSSAADTGETPESCAVCLYDFKAEEEIRCLPNCKHIFHQACLDRWMDHDQKTCPLCRNPVVPDDMQDEYNQRLWAASGVNEYYAEYSSVL